jgi:hypothetical protein
VVDEMWLSGSCAKSAYSNIREMLNYMYICGMLINNAVQMEQTFDMTALTLTEIRSYIASLTLGCTSSSCCMRYLPSFLFHPTMAVALIKRVRVYSSVKQLYLALATQTTTTIPIIKTRFAILTASRSSGM